MTLSSAAVNIYLIKSNFDYKYRSMLKVIILNLRWHFTYLLEKNPHAIVSLHWYFNAFPLFHIPTLLPHVLLHFSRFEGVWFLYITINMLTFVTQVRIWLDRVNRYKGQSWQKLVIPFRCLWKKGTGEQRRKQGL